MHRIKDEIPSGVGEIGGKMKYNWCLDVVTFFVLFYFEFSVYFHIWIKILAFRFIGYVSLFIYIYIYNTVLDVDAAFVPHQNVGYTINILYISMN